MPGGVAEGSAIAPALANVYAPNVLSYLHERPPLLHFLTPVTTVDGKLPLLIGNLDGTPILPDRVPQVRLYGTTNATFPMGSWTVLSNSLTLSNGLLRVEGLTVTNGAGLLFRAVEVP